MREDLLIRNTVQNTFGRPAFEEQSISRFPDSLHQSVCSVDISTNCRENDRAHDQPGVMSPMGEIAIDENDIIIAFVSVSICRFRP